ncbi:MAG TPA: VOC family protein [Xanthomonadales bacterium]|nr:VOC family protein [Xanthomonadales bacterium]
MSVVRFQRANFLVSNLERALGFYRDILGFEVAFVKDSEADSYSYPVFEIERERSMRFAVLSTANQPRVMALTEVSGELSPVPHPRRSAIVVEIEDIDGVLEKSRQAGLKVYPEEHLVTQDGREGREIGIVDADDNLVVIYWITSK